MVRDFRKKPITHEELTQCIWYAVENDLIGGWDVSTVNKPESQRDPQKSEFEVGCFLTEKVAKHIVEIHNQWWNNYVDDTYSDNIMSVYNRELEESYIQAVLDKSDPFM